MIDRKRIETDPDFIAIKRFEYSLKKVLERYPEGAPTKVIAAALLMSEEDVEEMYQQVVIKMREKLKID